jgi:signal transduction histidine kinase
MIAVPVQSQNRAIGTLLALRTHDGEPFRPEDVPLLTSFAEQAAIAIEFAEKTRAQRQLAVFGDRDRIARDLHDHVIQRLFATGLQLQSTLRRSTEPPAQQRIQRAVEDLDEVVKEIRTSIFDLHAVMGRVESGLRRRLLETAVEAAGTGRAPTVRINGAVDTLVPAEIGPHALAVVREGVSNAIRHGGASSVTVTVEAGAELLIDVFDNGVGIDPTAARSGLRNLEDRARQCGGELTIRAEALGGTRLSWRVPLP